MSLFNLAFSAVKAVFPKQVEDATREVYQRASDFSADVIARIPGDHAARTTDANAISATANSFRKEKTDAMLAGVFETFGMAHAGTEQAGVQQAGANTCTAAQVQKALASNQPEAYTRVAEALMAGRGEVVGGASLSVSASNRAYLNKAFGNDPKRLESELLQTALMEYATRCEGGRYDRPSDSVIREGKNLGKGLPVAWQKHLDALGVTRTAEAKELTQQIEKSESKSSWLARLIDAILPGYTERNLATLETLADAIAKANAAERNFVVNLKVEGDAAVDGHAYRLVEVKGGKISLAAVKTDPNAPEEIISLTPDELRDRLLMRADGRIGEYTGETTAYGGSVGLASAFRTPFASAYQPAPRARR